MTRRHDLDLIRVGVFFLLILYHTSLIFGTRPFVVKAEQTSLSFDVIHAVSHPWRMVLLFFISGVVTSFTLGRLTPIELRGKRSRQLLVPFLFGVFLLVPPQVYVSLRVNYDLDVSLIQVVAHFLTFSPIPLADGRHLPIFRVEHLWYLGCLWAYTAAAMFILGMRPDLQNILGDYIAKSLVGWRMFFIPIVLLAAVRLALRPIFPPSLDFVHDWYSHSVYFTFFCFGILVAKKDQFWEQLSRHRHVATCVCLICVPVLVITTMEGATWTNSRAYRSFDDFMVSSFRWSAFVAILGYGRLRRNVAHPVVNYLNGAVMTYYITHQTIAILLAYCLLNLGLLKAGTFIPLSLATFVGCAIIYEIKRRIGKKTFLQRLASGV